MIILRCKYCKSWDLDAGPYAEVHCNGCGRNLKLWEVDFLRVQLEGEATLPPTEENNFLREEVVPMR